MESHAHSQTRVISNTKGAVFRQTPSYFYRRKLVHRIRTILLENDAEVASLQEYQPRSFQCARERGGAVRSEQLECEWGGAVGNKQRKQNEERNVQEKKGTVI